MQYWAFLYLLFFLSFSLWAAPRTDENAAWNVNYNRDGREPKYYYGQWEGHDYFPSPDDWRKHPVYQVITDRVADGDPTNNELEYGGYDLYRVDARHGGDFLGLAERLHYIKSLGYTAVWISPIFQNEFNSYHGYGQVDFTLLDKRFGTLADFRHMVNKAHALGMYIIVDIVVNHLSDRLFFEGHPHGNAPFRFHTGEYRLLSKRLGKPYTDFDVVNQYFSSGRYETVYGSDGYPRFDPGGGSFWLSDFHHNGDLRDYGDPWQNHLGKIYGTLDDLRTTHPRVREKITAMTKALISSTDIDGIRMDTPMQVALEFFKSWTPEIKAHAARLGKTNFLIFGEHYCSRQRAATMIGRGKTPPMFGEFGGTIDQRVAMDSGINYRMYFDFFMPTLKYQSGGTGRGFEQYAKDQRTYDLYHPESQTHRYRQLNFYNNHDQWRLAWGQDGQQRTDLGSAMIGLWPGIPLFYYGDEQGFASRGTALDGWSREGLSTSKAWYDVPAWGRQNPAVGDNFNMTHPSFLHVQKIMNLRRAYPALHAPDTIYPRWVQVNGSNGILAYTMAKDDPSQWALVVHNTWSQPLSAGGSLGDFYSGWEEGQKIVNLLNPDEVIKLERYGTIPFLRLHGYESKVFVLEEKKRQLPPVVTRVSIPHDQHLLVSPEVMEIQFSQPMAVESLWEGLRINQQPVDASALAYDPQSHTLIYAGDFDDGLHTLSLEETIVLSAAGQPLFGSFQTRFRIGMNPMNPILNTQKDYLYTPGLVQSWGEGEISLMHQAPEAEFLRISWDAVRWRPWQPYRSMTTHRLRRGDVSKVHVQYWSHGSAAYFSYEER